MQLVRQANRTTYGIRFLVFITISRCRKAAQTVSHAKNMPTDQEVAEYRADDTYPDQHVVCINPNKVPFAIDPAPDLLDAGS